MSIFDKLIPNELKKVGTEAVDFIRSGSQKLVPKEIRKFLPYLAAAAPYTNVMFPGSGFFSGAIGRGLLSSLYNVAGQAAADPEGEDINALSALLAGAQGFGATPGAGDTLRGFTTKGNLADQGIIGSQARMDMANRGFLTKAKDLGITGIQGVEDMLQAPKTTGGFLGKTKAITKAAGPAVTTQLTQDAVNLAKQAEQDYLDELAEYERVSGEAQTASDADRRSAIITAMTAGRHSQDVIDETLSLLGLDTLFAKDGGIASFKDGGIMDLRAKGGMSLGPGTEKSDDIPAMLSDGEFVMTARAVRGMGGGSRAAGAKKLYNMMDAAEKNVPS